MLVVKDFAASFLDAPISSSATTLTVLDASVLPDLTAPGSFCWFVLQSATDRSKIEIVRAISQVGKTYTVQRGWHTTPTAFAAGDYIEQRITVDTFAYYAEQIIAGLAEAGSGNLLRDGGPAYVAISDALSQLTASFTSHVNSNGVHAISAITGLQAALNTIVPSSEFETGAGEVMRVNGPRDQQIANALANTTGGAYVSASAPPSPFQGMRWFDTTVGRTFIYYIDASNHGQWVEENPQSPDWITTAPVIAGIAQNTTMLSHRNQLINGDFRINQRGYASGVSLTAGQYCFDRWKLNEAGNITFSTMSNTTIISIPAGKTFSQVIEGLNLVSGVYTLSWLGTAQGKIGGGSFGSSGIKATIIGGTDTTITFNAGTLACVQLERSEVATPFEHRPYGYELSLCQRYYQRIWLPLGGNAYTSNVAIGQSVTYPVTMRATPTVSVVFGATSINLSAQNFDQQTSSGLRSISTASSQGPWNWLGTLALDAEL